MDLCDIWSELFLDVFEVGVVGVRVLCWEDMELVLCCNLLRLRRLLKFLWLVDMDVFDGRVKCFFMDFLGVLLLREFMVDEWFFWWM